MTAGTFLMTSTTDSSINLPGTQELQLGRDENLGGSRGKQSQQPRHSDHGSREKGPPSHVSRGSSESCSVAQKEDVNQGNDLNKDSRAFQNCDVDTSAPVSKIESNHEVDVVRNVDSEVITREDLKTDQNVQSRDEIVKDVVEKISVVPSDKSDTNEPQSKNVSSSGKKKKKKRKSKHKQKQDCHDKDGNVETGGPSEQLPEPLYESAECGQITAESNSVAKTTILEPTTNLSELAETDTPNDLSFQGTADNVQPSDQLGTTDAKVALASIMDDTSVIDEQLVDSVAETYTDSNGNEILSEDPSQVHLSEEQKDHEELALVESNVDGDEDDKCAESCESESLHCERNTESFCTKPDLAAMGTEEQAPTEGQQEHEEAIACTEQTSEAQIVLNDENESVD